MPELSRLPLPSVYRATTMVSPGWILVFSHCLPGRFGEQLVPAWTLRISSDISEGIRKQMVYSDRKFLNTWVSCRQ